MLPPNSNMSICNLLKLVVIGSQESILHIFSQLCLVTSVVKLKSAMVGVFTPQKMADTTHKGIFFGRVNLTAQRIHNNWNLL